MRSPKKEVVTSGIHEQVKKKMKKMAMQNSIEEVLSSDKEELIKKMKKQSVAVS